MNRRRYLLAVTAAGVAGLAGCLEEMVSAGDSDPEANPAPTPTPEETPQHDDELGELQSVAGPPLELTDATVVQHPEPLELFVEIDDAMLTADGVPKLGLTLSNPTDENHEVFYTIELSPVWDTTDVEPENQFILWPTDELKRPADTTCLAAENVGYSLTGVHEVIEPGEQRMDDRWLYPWASDFTGGCPDAGTYRASTELGLETPAKLEFTIQAAD